MDQGEFWQEVYTIGSSSHATFGHNGKEWVDEPPKLKNGQICVFSSFAPQDERVLPSPPSPTHPSSH